MSKPTIRFRPPGEGGTMAATESKEPTMAKYLLLKHYRGGPEKMPDHEASMDQWTEQEITDHFAFMDHVVQTLTERGEYVDSQALSPRARSCASTPRASRRSPRARSPRPRTSSPAG